MRTLIPVRSADTRGRRRRVGVVAVPIALLLAAGLTYRASLAAFTATTDNSGNSWTAGSVTLTDNDSGTALFSVTGLVPAPGANSSGQRCIVVTYGGDITSSVSLGATVAGTPGGPADPSDDGLHNDLELTVQMGTGSAADCSDFASSSTFFGPAVMSGFPTTASPTATTWSPTASGQTRTFRFYWQLPSGTPNHAQGDSATASFTWTATSA